MYPACGKFLIVQGEIPTNDTIGSHLLDLHRDSNMGITVLFLFLYLK